MNALMMVRSGPCWCGLRAAAALNIHHSTLQERVAQAERHLGWALHDVDGQTRLATALMARRIRQTT